MRKLIVTTLAAAALGGGAALAVAQDTTNGSTDAVAAQASPEATAATLKRVHAAVTGFIAVTMDDPYAQDPALRDGQQRRQAVVASAAETLAADAHTARDLRETAMYMQEHIDLGENAKRMEAQIATWRFMWAANRLPLR